MTIDQAADHIGATVIYRPNPATVEHGVIESVNDNYVHVRYGTGKTAKATAPDLLELTPIPTGAGAK